MLFFKPNIDEALQKAVAKLKPAYVSSQAEAQRAFENQFKQVVQEIQPLLDHINKKIAEKNYIIDTPESYLETTKLCKNWQAYYKKTRNKLKYGYVNLITFSAYFLFNIPEKFHERKVYEQKKTPVAECFLQDYL